MNNNGTFFLWFITVVASVMLFSCNNRFTSTLFKSKSPHQQYEQRLKDAGLEGSTLFNQWISSSDRSLQQPLTISIPYLEKAYFAGDKPEAAGFIFEARNGEQLQIKLTLQTLDSARMFIDLFEAAQDTNTQYKNLFAADTGDTSLVYDISDNGKYILRIQPELLSNISYELTITAEPSLATPVGSAAKPNIGSFFGDGRDAGIRKHEGIDIFAKRLTPAVAAANGIISNVGTNNLGGKVVFLKPEGRPINLYYAHLDSQLVTTGQSVVLGDTIGLIGNTGNARTTPPHLHFGIYTPKGAVDPLPFVRPGKSTPSKIIADIKQIGDTVRATVRKDNLYNTPLVIEAASQNGYRVILPNKNKTFILQSQVASLSQPLKTITLNQPKLVFTDPDQFSSSIIDYPIGAKLVVIGEYSDFYLIKRGSIKGWILQRP